MQLAVRQEPSVHDHLHGLLPQVRVPRILDIIIRVTHGVRTTRDAVGLLVKHTPFSEAQHQSAGNTVTWKTSEDVAKGAKGTGTPSADHVAYVQSFSTTDALWSANN